MSCYLIHVYLSDVHVGHSACESVYLKKHPPRVQSVFSGGSLPWLPRAKLPINPLSLLKVLAYQIMVARSGVPCLQNCYG